MNRVLTIFFHYLNHEDTKATISFKSKFIQNSDIARSNLNPQYLKSNVSVDFPCIIKE